MKFIDNKMDNKGQMSVEYLLVVLVVILVLSIVTIPLISNSIDASNDVSHSSDAKVSASTIANAADTVYANGPGAKRTISFYIPESTKIILSDKKVIIPIQSSSNGIINVNATTQYSLDDKTLTVNKGWYDAVVSWEVGAKVIDVKLTNI